MKNVAVKEFKMQIQEQEYTFRLDFKALMRFTERYEDALVIFNEFLSGVNIYGCIVKILSCACKEREFTEEELSECLPFNLKTMKIADEITFSLIEGVFKPAEGNSEEKN